MFRIVIGNIMVVITALFFLVMLIEDIDITPYWFSVALTIFMLVFLVAGMALAWKGHKSLKEGK